MSDIPKSWTLTRLSNISEVQMGQSPDSRSYNDHGEGLPFFQGKAEFGPLYPTVRKWCSEPKKIAEAGDILLSIRAPVGPTNLATERCCIGRGLAAIRAADPISQMYLLHYLRHLEPWLSRQGTGSTFMAISGDFVRAIEIPLPPLAEQQRIADKLDALLARVEACRARLARVPAILKRFRQAVLAAAVAGRLMEDNEESPDVWQRCNLGTVLTDIRYGTAQKSEYNVQDGTPVLRIPNIGDGRIDPTDLKYGHFSGKDIDSLSLKRGDLLLIRSNGSVELVGKAAVVEPEFEGYLYAGYLIRLRVDLSQVDPRYLYICLSSPATRSHIELTARSTSGVNNINSDEIRAIEIALPSLAEQYEIARRVKALFAYADRLEARLAAARAQVEQITPSLLAQAFQGELVAQDAEDEPADQLLKSVQNKVSSNKGRDRKPRRIVSGRSVEVPYNGGFVLDRTRLNPDYLSVVLRNRGPLTAEVLWIASQLSIDDFYDQLKDEEERFLLHENWDGSPHGVRLLEAK